MTPIGHTADVEYAAGLNQTFLSVCCLREERYRHAVQSKGLSLVPHLPILVLCCSCCILGSFLSFHCTWSCTHVEEAQCLLGDQKNEILLEKRLNHGNIAHMGACVCSAAHTNQWKMPYLHTVVFIISHYLLALGIWEGLTGVLTQGLLGVCVGVVPDLGFSQRVCYPLPRCCAWEGVNSRPSLWSL